MPETQQRRSFAGWAATALISMALCGGFVVSGGLGTASQGHAAAPPKQAGVGVLACVPAQQVHGTVVVDSKYIGTLNVGLFYEVFPKRLGPAQWVDTGDRAVAYFHDKQPDAYRRMGAYWFGFIPQPWHAEYRVQVVRPGPALVLGAASPSFRLCDPSPASPQETGVVTVTADAKTITVPAPADPPTTETVTQTVSVDHPTTQTITQLVPTTTTATSTSIELLPEFETVTTTLPTTETVTDMETTTSVVTQPMYITVTANNTATDTSTVTSSSTDTSTVTSSTTDTSTVTSSTTDTSTVTSTSTTFSTSTSGSCHGNSTQKNGNNCS